MSTDATPPPRRPPDDDLPLHLASPGALARWNEEHPEEAKRVEEWMRRLAAGELGDATSEMRELAAKFVWSQVGQRSLTEELREQFTPETSTR